MKKPFIKKAIVATICSASVFLGAIGATYGYFTYKANDYIANNQSFLYTKVTEQVDYWGGDIRYIDRNENRLLMKTSPLSTHLNVGDRPVKVGYSDNISQQAKEQFDNTFNYFNKIFETINPNYKFETSYAKKKDCDIYIEFSELSDEIGAQVNTVTDFINPSRITSAHIKVNYNHTNDNVRLRYFLAHEMIHVLLGAHDVNPSQSKTFSVFNSPDVNFICSKIDKAKIPEKDTQYNTPYYLTEEQKASFITLLPTDISTLISVYGNPTQENSEKYLALLNYTKQKCENFFGDQPYYEKGYTLPNQEELEK